MTTAINNSGQIVGWRETVPDNWKSRHAFLWQSGTLTKLGPVGGEYDVMVNARGTVVYDRAPSVRVEGRDSDAAP
ncbi:MAG: hypothetical protein ACM3QU_02190 [Verrucomicrobiota bacterium]